MKRHEILGRNLHETREVTLSLMADRDAKFVARTAPGQPQQQFARERQIGSAVWRAVLEHLGYGPIDDLLEYLNAGVDNTLEYFLGAESGTGSLMQRGCLDRHVPGRVPSSVGRRQKQRIYLWLH